MKNKPTHKGQAFISAFSELQKLVFCLLALLSSTALNFALWEKIENSTTEGASETKLLG